MRFLFGDYALDLDRRELRRGADLIPTAPQVFDLLAHLMQNRDRVVSKEDLLNTVWRGRVVSESTLTSQINAARKALGDSGEEQRLIRTIARKGFRFVGAVSEAVDTGPEENKPALRAAHESSGPGATFPLPDAPSIAVLPFQNLSGDPEQEYFADGIVEDIIIALSRMRGLFVIARNSSFTYKGRAVDVKQVGRELGVRYIVEGGVRKAADRVRITAQLVDATAGTYIWAERFEGPLQDVFDLQDRVTESIVGAIAPTLEQAEIERAKRKPTENLDAYDLFLRGMANFYQRTNEANSEALSLFYSAIELDAGFASPYGMAARCYVWRKFNGWMTDRAREVAEGARLARLAVDLAKGDALALARGGHALAMLTGDLDSGIAIVDRALAINPNLAVDWYLSGFLRAFRGEPDVAIEHFARGMRLNPLDPETFRMQGGTAFAHLFAGRFNQACEWAERSFLDQPTYITASAVMAASNALAGRMAEARRAAGHLQGLDPALRVSNLKDWFPIRRPEDFAKLSEGLRRAGLPD